MQLALFLHYEGLKLKPKIERSCSSFSKLAGASEQENAICHEDEALFGDLFSETARSVGSTDGREQPGTENAFGEEKSVELAGSMISSLVEFGKFACLISALSSLLDKYLQAHQKAFLGSLSYQQKSASNFSPFLLMKHTGIDKSLQDELLERSGCNEGELKSILGLLSQLDATVEWH
ncbi:hypothetical protein S83_001599 [Arachis hypogaea]